VEPLIADLAAIGFPVAASERAVEHRAHAGLGALPLGATDASGIVKALMDDLIGHFTSMDLPASSVSPSRAA